MQTPFPHTSSIIIIGSGLGGLLCGAILAMHGYRITVIEKEKQLGGCLQSFAFEKELFDSCVHYIGGMKKGENQRAIFDFLGITDALQLELLDTNAFDTIIVDDKRIPLAQGYAQFEQQLIPYFPEEKIAINNYIQLVQETCKKVPLFNLRIGNATEKESISNISINEQLSALGLSEKLQHTLTGNSLLYAGEKDVTPFLNHALIMHSYISGSYKFSKGSAQLTKALANIIRQHEGKIINKTKIVKIYGESDKILYIADDSGMQWTADQYICNIHPDQVIPLLDNIQFKGAYTKRIKTAPNSVSSFMLNINLKPHTLSYSNSNIYWTNGDPLLSTQIHEDAFNNFAIYHKQDSDAPEYCKSIAILAYDDINLYNTWLDTYHTTLVSEERAAHYQTFKQERAKKLLALVDQHYQNISEKIHTIQIATPLTFKDYMGTKDGSMYGIKKNVQVPMHNQVPVQTKAKNLFFTGQNVNLHGILGVSMSALQTCGHFIDLEKLLKTINKYR